MPFLGFIMSVVIRGVASGTCLDTAGFKQLPHSLKQRFVHRSIQSFFSLTKLQRLTAGLKAPNPSIGT